MLRVLVVDDEPFVREGLKLLIDWREEGYEIAAEARNAYEAIELISNESFDLIILDILMPKMNGIELSKVIREKYSKTVNIIFLTGYLEPEYVNEAFRVKAVQYLSKPIQAKVLLDTLRDIRLKLENDKENERKYKRRVNALREYYIAELLHGTKKEEYLNYLRSVFRSEQKIYYIHFIFYPDKKEDVETQRFHEQLSELKIEFQSRLMERTYSVIAHLPGQYEQAIGVVITEKTLKELRLSIYELVDKSLEKVGSKKQLRVVAKIGKPVNDIGNLLDAYKDSLTAVPYTLRSKEIPLEIRLNSYLQAHYMENITIKSLSETFYVNSAYLGQFFKKHNGVYLKEYLNLIRVKKAAEMLLNSTMKIYQIAESVGFQSADSFISAFSKQMNRTPQKYRQENVRLQNTE